MDTTPIVSTPEDMSFEPTTHCVNHWPEKVMGFDTCGGSPTQPAGVDYARTPQIQDSTKDVKVS